MDNLRNFRHALKVLLVATILFIISGAWAIRVLCLFSARNSRFVKFRTQPFYFTSVSYISFLLHGLIDALHKSYLGTFGYEALQYVLLISSAVIRSKSTSYQTFYSIILTRVCLIWFIFARDAVAPTIRKVASVSYRQTQTPTTPGYPSSE